MTDPIRLLLADDQQMVRAGFRLVLDAQPDMSVVGEANDGAEALQLVDELAPDVVLMDIRMPVLDGLGATEKIMTSHPEAKILVLTTFDLDEYVHSALRAGASGFMLKDAGPTELLAAIRAVRDGDSVVAPSATRRLIERFIPRQGEGAATITDRSSSRLSQTGSARCLPASAKDSRTPRSPNGSTWPRRPSKPTLATSCQSWGCATASPWSSRPMMPVWCVRVADLSVDYGAAENGHILLR